MGIRHLHLLDICSRSAHDMSDQDVLLTGIGKLVGSQVFTRIATFGLNQVVTRSLSVEAFGLLAVKFHLINTSILTLSREGLRRGCLRSQQDGFDSKALLKLSSLCIPLGAVVTLFFCWFFGPRPADQLPGYSTSVWLQGAAALVELLSEPLYILAQARLEFGLRVRIEAAATVCKILATLLLLQLHLWTEAVALSVAQVAYAAVTLLGYAWHFLARAHGSRGKIVRKGGEGSIRRKDVVVCCSFAAQAFEKLLLAEGTKMAMAQVQAAYDQGVYGLVVNLGSLVVRTLFQPVEEAAFIAFSQPLSSAGKPSEHLLTLLPLTRSAILFGLLATAFGPSNTFMLLHALYGSKYSATEAPAALAVYCPYILLLAVNGILECFVHAVAAGPQLVQGHLVLLLITALQTAATLVLMSARGTLGMIAADAGGMALRVLYSTTFIARHAARLLAQEAGPPQKGTVSSVPGGAGPHAVGLSSQRLLQQALPTVGSVCTLASAGLLSAVSASVCFGSGFLSHLVPALRLGFWAAAAGHIAVESVLLGMVLTVLYRTERPLLLALKALKQKRE